MYGALLYGREYFEILYSDFCAAAPLVRAYKWELVRKQMNRIHKPHLESGYLKSVTIRKVVNQAEQPDWVLRYTPGEKARAEYRAFNEKPLPARPTAPRLLEAPTANREKDAPAAAQKEEPELAQRLRVELHIGGKQALQCATQHQADARAVLAAKECFPDWQNKTGGFWFRAITEGYELPRAYVAQRAAAAQKSNFAEKKARIAACPFCRDTDLPGSRRVFSARHPRGAWKECTHDPEIENKFSVSA